MTTVFLSYRRDDNQWATRRIAESLERYLSEDDIFMDVDSVAPGVDFLDVVNQEIAKCDTLLAVIGPRWVGDIDPDTGKSRLFNDEDYVRNEIVAALDRGIPVVPILIDDTKMPPKSQLPKDLHAFSRRNAYFLTDRNFDHDVDNLAHRLGLKKLAKPTPPKPAPLKPPQQKPQKGGTIAMVLIGCAAILMVALYATSEALKDVDWNELDGTTEVVATEAAEEVYSETGAAAKFAEGASTSLGSPIRKPETIAPKVVNGSNITAVYVTGGQLEMVSPGNWKQAGPNGQSHSFQEVGRDDGAVYLQDYDHFINMKIDTYQAKVFVENYGLNRADQYDIIRMKSP